MLLRFSWQDIRVHMLAHSSSYTLVVSVAPAGTGASNSRLLAIANISLGITCSDGTFVMSFSFNNAHNPCF